MGSKNDANYMEMRETVKARRRQILSKQVFCHVFLRPYSLRVGLPATYCMAVPARQEDCSKENLYLSTGRTQISGYIDHYVTNVIVNLR